MIYKMEAIVIKQCIKEYYDRLRRECYALNKAPMVPFNPRIPDEMYVGSEDEQGYISWKLVERDKHVNQELLAKNIGFILHDALLEYINSYYFLDISGLFNGSDVALDSITPHINIGKFILRRCENLSINSIEKRYIQIGIINEEGDDNYLLCFDNRTGRIVKYNFDSETIHLFAASLPELISAIKPRC